MLPPHIQTEQNFLRAISDIISKLQQQHKEEMSKLDKQHSERMSELYKQGEEAKGQFEQTLNKANIQIKIAWGAFAVAVATLIVTLIK